jgi:hypothetical protein
MKLSGGFCEAVIARNMFKMSNGMVNEEVVKNILTNVGSQK